MIRKFSLLVFAALSLAACTGVSTARIVTNGPAEVAVDGQYFGRAPVSIPIPWRNVDNTINYSQRRVTVTAEGGTVVFDREISAEINQKAQTGDFQDGSQFGTGRTYTFKVDVHAGTPAGGRP